MSSDAPVRDTSSQRVKLDLDRSTARCQIVADQIYDSVVQDLAALAFSLGASAACRHLSDDEGTLLTARVRAIQQCSRLLSAVAERLADLDGPAEPAAESAGPAVRAGRSE